MENEYLSKIKLREREFHSEFTEVLSRIETVLNYHKENSDRLQNSENKKYVRDFCQIFWRLRGVFDEKYGFDVGMSQEKYVPEESNKLIRFLPHNTTGINVNSDILFRYHNLYGLVSETQKKLEAIK